MSGSKRANDLSKASKYISKIDIDFKGVDRALVNMLVREAYIAGLNTKPANEAKQPQEADICHNIVCCPSCKSSDTEDMKDNGIMWCNKCKTYF